MGAAAEVRFAGLQLTYDAVYETMLATVDRRTRLDKAIEKMVADSEFTPVTRRLGAFVAWRR